MDSKDTTSADVREGTPPAPTKNEESKPPADAVKSSDGDTKVNERPDAKKKVAREKCSKKHPTKGKSKKTKKAASPSSSSSDSDSDSDDGDSEASSSSSSDDDQSEAERSRKKRLAKKHQEPQKTKQKSRDKKHKKASRRHDSSESDSDLDSDSDSADSKGTSSSDDEGNQRLQTELAKQLQLFFLQQQQQQQQQQHGGAPYGYPPGLRNQPPPPIQNSGLRHTPPRPRRMGGRPPGRSGLGGVDGGLVMDGKQQKGKKKRQKATKLDYKRVDQVWDDAIHNYKLQDTAERTVDAQYEEFIFHVRRTFDWEGKYKATIVDIKSKLLRACLQEVIGDVKGISLVDDTPKLDPNMLFL